MDSKSTARDNAKGARFVWLLFFVFALVVFNWFDKDSFVLQGDLAWPQFFSRFFYWCTYVWDASVNYGYAATRQSSSFFPYASYGLLLERILSPGPTVQFIIYYLSFAFSGVGMYFLSRNLGLGAFGAFWSGFFYMFNPYAAAVAWVPSYGITFPFYCYLPIALYFFHEFMQTPSTGRKAQYILGTFLLFFGTSYSNPAFAAVFVLLILVLAIHLIFAGTDDRSQVCLGTLAYGLALAALNAFWFFPLLYNLGGEYQGASNQTAGLISDIENIRLCSVKVTDALKMTGLWALKGGHLGDYYYDWHQAVDASSYIAVAFIIPLLAVMRCAAFKKYPSRAALTMLALLLSGIVLNSGAIAGGLIGSLAHAAYSLSFVQRAFRGVFLKLAVLLVIPLVYLAASMLEISAQRLSNTRKALLCGLLMSLFLIFNAKPFLNGSIIKSKGRNLPSARVHIPDEYYALKNFDSRKKLDARCLSLPIPPSYNHLLKWQDGGFLGADFLRHFVARPLVYINDGKDVTSWLVDCVNDPHDHCAQLFNVLNIKYVFQHKDIAPVWQDYYLVTRAFADARFHPIFPTRYFDVFENQDLVNFLPHLYSAENLGIVWNLSREPKSFLADPRGPSIRQAIFSYGDAQQREKLNALIRGVPTLHRGRAVVLEYRKINPTNYRIRIHGASGTVPIVFSESYDPKWQAFAVTSEASSAAPQPITDYSVQAGNEPEQASAEEVRRFAASGHVTGTGKAFISKNIQGTIQNDNLPNGPFWETWLKQPVHGDETHFLVNGYANGWLIDTFQLCRLNKSESASACRTNTDGTTDFELVLQYRPQKLFYIGLIVTGAALLGLLAICCVHLGRYIFRINKLP